MPTAEHDPLGPGFEWRLKAALDRLSPPPYLTNARYRSMSPPARVWRLAPALLAIGTAGILALSATAATGSPSPAVWTQRAASTIGSMGHAPETSPISDLRPSPNPHREPGGDEPGAAPLPSHDREASPRPEPAATPHGSPRPEPSESPASSDRPSQTNSPSPSPSPADH